MLFINVIKISQITLYLFIFYKKPSQLYHNLTIKPNKSKLILFCPDIQCHK